MDLVLDAATFLLLAVFSGRCINFDEVRSKRLFESRGRYAGEIRKINNNAISMILYHRQTITSAYDQASRMALELRVIAFAVVSASLAVFGRRSFGCVGVFGFMSELLFFGAFYLSLRAIGPQPKSIIDIKSFEKEFQKNASSEVLRERYYQSVLQTSYYDEHVVRYQMAVVSAGYNMISAGVILFALYFISDIR
jgi:hypothetical protein